MIGKSQMRAKDDVQKEEQCATRLATSSHGWSGTSHERGGDDDCPHGALLLIVVDALVITLVVDAAAIVGWLNSDGDDFCVALPAHGVSRE
jgi:hypothetical protein